MILSNAHAGSCKIRSVNYRDRSSTTIARRSGTKPRGRCPLPGCKADMAFALHMSAFGPKRKSTFGLPCLRPFQARRSFVLHHCEDGRLPFCKAILHHKWTRHAPMLPRERSRAPTRAGRTPSATRPPLHLLERTQHNVFNTARLTGIDRLYRMMKKHGIARKE